MRQADGAARSPQARNECPWPTWGPSRPKCGGCGKQYKSDITLGCHLRRGCPPIPLPEDRLPLRLECRHLNCTKTFGGGNPSKARKGHEQTVHEIHEYIRPKCDRCGQEFATLAKVRRHKASRRMYFTSLPLPSSPNPHRLYSNKQEVGAIRPMR